jgi:hypothetical protein
MFGTLTSAQIEQVLKNQLVGHLACHAHNRTYIVPISYAYDGQFIYVHTYEGLKIQMMRENPEVCFQVDERADMGNWKSVIAWGHFEELPNGKGRARGIEVLTSRRLPILSSSTTHLGVNWPFSKGEPAEIDGIVFRIALMEKTGRFEQTMHSPYFAE